MVRVSLILALTGLLGADALAETVRLHEVCELSFHAAQPHEDPYNEVDLEAVFTTPSGQALVVPGFWVGGENWKVRFAGDAEGAYPYTTRLRTGEDAGLSGKTGTVTVAGKVASPSAFARGRLVVAEDKRHFETLDGQPFFWMADTWWMGLSKRLDWPEGFHWLAEDRVEKGFNVVQIIAGPYPDMDGWDPRGESEAGFPFQAEFKAINADYYNLADQKIAHLVDSGLTPCIVGMWGYYLPQLGVEKVTRYWRYLVARYGAYPVVWCIAGEATMPYYLSETKKEDAEQQKAGWTEVMRSVRNTDPFRNLITIHPTQFGREQVLEPGLMDFEMLQTGHSDMDSIPNVIRSVRKAVAVEPRMPVVNSEINYEGILGRAWQNVQRLCFYHAAMNGVAGCTYGANGIWQLNAKDKPYGPSPHGRSWGNTPWREAAMLPGSAQVAHGAQFLAHLPWWQFEFHPEWIKGGAESDKPYDNVSVGIPGKLRLIYAPMCWDPPVVLALESDRAWTAAYFDPVSGQRLELGSAAADVQGAWTPPLPPEVHDWLLLVEAGATR